MLLKVPMLHVNSNICKYILGHLKTVLKERKKYRDKNEKSQTLKQKFLKATQQEISDNKRKHIK